MDKTAAPFLLESFIGSLYVALQQAAQPNRRAGMEAYMRHQFQFLGVDTTTRRLIFKHWLKNSEKIPYALLPACIGKMWQMEREMQYCAIELALLYKNEWTEEFIETMEVCIITKSWWDTVDTIAANWCGTYFKKYPKQIKQTKKWNHSSNIWLQRSSILFQMKYKEATDTKMLTEYIVKVASSNEFFLQKAVGWALREYAKTNPNWVKDFVTHHPLKPLSKREALKHF